MSREAPRMTVHVVPTQDEMIPPPGCEADRQCDTLTPVSDATTKGHTMTTTPAITGSVSHGTLRPQDLAPAFLSTLYIIQPDHPRMAEFRDEVEYVVAEQRDDDVTYYMRADETVMALADAIDEALPEGWHFGTIEGDGSDYGVWEYDEDDLI